MASREMQDFKVCEDEKHDLECPICLFLVREAMEMPCSHLLCKECVERLSLTTEETKLPLCCPICKGQFKMQEIHRNTYADRMVRNLNVYCPRRQNGCEWKGTIPSYRSNHDNLCEYEPVVCRHAGCSFFTGRKLLLEHEQNCQFRYIKCQYCDGEVQFLYLKEHDGICTRFPIHCLNEGCEVVSPRNEMKDHVQNECEFTIVRCTFYPYGCHHQFERRKQDDHDQTFTAHHITLMFHQNEKVQKDYIECKSRLEQSREHAKYLEKELELLQTENRNQNAKIEKQNTEVEELRKRITLLETKPKVSLPESKGEDNLKSQSCPPIHIRQILSNGADKWIRKKECDLPDDSYSVWFHEIFDLLVGNKLYQCENELYVKIRNDRKLSIVRWFSNSKAEQEKESRSKFLIHKAESKLLLKSNNKSWLNIETETLDIFNNKNSICVIFHPHKQQMILGLGRWINNSSHSSWNSLSISNEFYVNNYLIVGLIKS